MKPRWSLAERFWEKVRKPATPCWIWVGSRTKGYGRIKQGGRGVNLLAHRVAYELTKGPIPEGKELNHLCENSICVNPEHLEVTDRSGNMNYGLRVNAAKTHCPRGHEYNEANTYLTKKRKARECRACWRIRYRAKKAAQGSRSRYEQILAEQDPERFLHDSS